MTWWQGIFLFVTGFALGAFFVVRFIGALLGRSVITKLVWKREITHPDHKVGPAKVFLHAVAPWVGATTQWEWAFVLHDDYEIENELTDTDVMSPFLSEEGEEIAESVAEEKPKRKPVIPDDPTSSV